MVDAGKIRVSLDLNADDLASEITRAIERELEPVLRRIQLEIDETARDLNKIDGKSFLEVAVDAKVAEREISKQADAAEKAAIANEADAKALRDLAKAEAEFAAAQKSGDLVKRTAAMQNLMKATEAYEKATGRSAGAAREAAVDLDNMGNVAEKAGRKRTSAEKAVQDEIARTEAAERRAARAAEDNARRAERAAQDAQIAAARRAAQDEADARRRADRLAQIAAEAAKRAEVREAEDSRRRAARHEQDVRDATARATRAEMQERQRAERAAAAETARMERTAAREAERVAREAERAGGVPGGPGGGGFGGGGGGGSRRPSFGTGQYGGRNFVTRFAMNPIGANAIGLGLAGIPAATAGLTSLAGAIQEVTQAGLAVPGVMAGIGASVATAAVGLSGMKDAVKALTKAQRDDDPKEMSKAYDQIKDMAPAAQQTALAVSGLANGAFKDLRKSVQGTMFAGVADDINRVGAALGPRLQTDMNKTAAAWNNTIHTITGQLTSGTNLSFMDRIFGNTADAQNRANMAIGPITHAIADMTAQSSNFLPRLATGLDKVATRFDNFVTKSINNGNFDKWTDQGLNGVDKLGNSVLNLGKSLEGVFKAEGGSGFLQWLQDATGRLDRFVESAKGQSEISAFFKQAREDAALWKPVLGDIFRLFGQMIEGAQAWSHILLPVLDNVLGTLTKVPGLVQGITAAFLAWRSISGVTDLLNKITGINSGLGAIGGKSKVAQAACATACECGPVGGVGGAAGGVTEEERARGTGRAARFGRAIGGFGATLGVGIGADQLLEGVNPDNRSNTGVGGWLQSIGGGAATGAGIGTFIEPGIGTAVGAAIGAAGGALIKGIETMFAENKPTAPSAVMKGALAPDDYRALVAQISQPGPAPGQTWNQQAVDQAVYGTSGSFDPRSFEFNTLKKGTQGYNDMAQRLLQSGLPGVTQDNVTQTLDTIIGQAQIAKGALDQLQGDIIDLPTGEVVLKDPTPEILQRVKDLGLGLKTLPNGLIAVDTTALDAANTKAANLQEKIAGLVSGQGGRGQFTPNPNAGGNALDPNFFMPGQATGGVLPGWSPGVDNMLVPMSGGEGVLVPHAVRRLGGAPAIAAINSMLGSGYATGGVVGFAGGGEIPYLPWYSNSNVLQGGRGPGNSGETNFDMLRQIRNLLSGAAPGPLSAMQMRMQSIATGGVPAGMLPPGTTPGRLGPFGTPIQPINWKYQLAAGALRGLGGDPDMLLGPDPVKYAQTNWTDISGKLRELAGQGGLGALGRSANPQDYIGPLTQFAQSGQITPDMARMGLDANNPIVTAIMSARNNKGYEQVPGYINQVLGQGAFTGQLTPENQAIISALSTFQTTLAKQQQVNQELEAVLAPLGGMRGLQTQLLTNPALAAGIPAALLPGAQMPAMPGGAVPGAATGGLAATLTQLPNGLWTSTNPEWAKLIQRESAGNPVNQNNSDANAAAGHPSQGLFQITQPTWIAHGGLALARTPKEATPQQQAQIAENILRARPSGEDWGLPGGGREDPAKLLAALGTGGPAPAAPAPPAPPGPVVPPPGPPANIPPVPPVNTDAQQVTVKDKTGKTFTTTKGEMKKHDDWQMVGPAPGAPAPPAPPGPVVPPPAPPAPAAAGAPGLRYVPEAGNAWVDSQGKVFADSEGKQPTGWWFINGKATKTPPAGAPAPPPGPAAPAPGGKAPEGAIYMPSLGGYMFEGQLHKEWAPPLGSTPGPGPNLNLPAAPTPPGPAAPAPLPLPTAPSPAPPAIPGMPAAPAALTAAGAGGLNLATIPVAAQQYANDCIDASARIILSHSGVNMTEDQLKAVIPAGSNIDAQARGLNQLNPAGLYQAMAGSGGSPEAMLAAIRASIDRGTGSILNVAPGSSIGGKNFGEGHFIAVTGYNADGTLNLSDTAGGTQYSVSAADAFQATRGRGIVAGTGTGPAPVQGPASPLAGGATPGLPGGLPGAAGGVPGMTNGLNSAGGIVPVYVVNFGGGGASGGGMGNMLQNILGGPAEAAAGAAAGVGGDALGAAASAIPGAFESPAGAAAPAASTAALIQEGNPLAGAAALGFKVPDMTRAGAVQLAGATFANPQQQYLANGTMLSNTTGLYQRTMTSLGEQLNAMRDQMVGATKDVSGKLADKALTPIMKAGVSTGMGAITQATLTSMGTTLGQTMAPPIGEAVAKNMPASSSSDASGLAGVPFSGANAITGAIGLAGGGPVTGGTSGQDSVPAMLMPREWVMTTDEVDKMGGFGGMQRFTAALGRSRGVRHYAAGGGVLGGSASPSNPNSTVGADFFGVSQVPIIGAIINMLVNILLTMIGAQITVRDTLTKLTDNFRQFRGDTFKAFDAQGRMFTDTSGLSERSQSSAQTVTDERVRILTQVLQALIKYIIDKVIVPIAEAVGQALINAGASAAGGALGPFGGGAITGGMSTIGDAAVQIAGQVGQDFGDAASAVIVQQLMSGGQELLPGLFTGIFSGAGVENMLTGPLGGLMGGITGGFTGLLMSLLGVLGLGMLGNNSGTLLGFDEGGVANGVGMMPKATIAPERVLSPSQTASFDRLVAALENGSLGSGNSTVIHAPFTVMGGAEGGAAARDRLLELL